MSRLRRKVDLIGLDNIRLEQRAAETLDLPDGSVDLLVSNLGINNFKDVDAVLRSCFRVARPGARFFLTTNPVGHMAEFYEVYRATLVELGLEAHLPALDAQIGHRGTIESVSDTLSRAGFDVVRADTSSFQMRFVDGSSFLRHHLIQLGFLPGWRSVLPEDVVDRTLEAVEQNLNTLAAESGELVVTIPIACIEARKPGEA